VHPVNMQNPTSPDQFKVVIAENQPEYTPLPAVVDRQSGVVITQWQLTDEERARLLAGGRLTMFTKTSGMPFQPVHLQVVEPGDNMPLEVVF
jgi:hypothetical protein